MHRNKVLIITRNFPPLWGGMERLNWHLADELAKYCNLRIIAPTGAVSTGLPTAISIAEVPLLPLLRFFMQSIWQALHITASWRPDVILAGSGLTAPLVWLAAKAFGGRAFVYLHGLDVVAPHPIYRNLWLPVLRHMDGIIANSHATAALARQIGIKRGQIHIVHPGVTLPDVDPKARERFRNRHKLGNRPILLSVGRLTERKGIKEFVTEVLPHIVVKLPDVLLVIVGDVPKNALHARKQTQQDIQIAANNRDVGKNIQFIGTLFGKELDDAFAAADIHVFPVRELPNDPEGFGMVAIEAAAHGLPTVAYATGGVIDAVREGVSGRLIAPNDTAGFARAVLDMLDKPICKDEVRAFASGFSWESFGRRIAGCLIASRS